MYQRILMISFVALFGACAPFSTPPPPSSIDADDSRISADVAMQFHDANLEGRENVRILVSDGRLTLEGALKSEDDVRVAVDLAGKVEGVESVNSRLTVSGQGGD